MSGEERPKSYHEIYFYMHNNIREKQPQFTKLMLSAKHYYFDAVKKGTISGHAVHVVLFHLLFKVGYADTNPLFFINQAELAKQLGFHQPQISKALKALCEAHILYKTSSGAYCFYEYFAHKGNHSQERIHAAKRLKDERKKKELILKGENNDLSQCD